MGYNVETMDPQDFRIPKARHPAALAAGKAVAPWGVREGQDLVEFLREVGFEVFVEDRTGDVAELQYYEKWGDLDTLFAALAPYVASGSYISFIGEDRSAWQFRFSGGGMESISGRLVFDRTDGKFSEEQLAAFLAGMEMVMKAEGYPEEKRSELKQLVRAAMS